MYLHQNNNSINVSSNTMSDTFHQQTNTTNFLNDETHNENENYLENYNQLNKLTDNQFNYNQDDLIKSTLSCSPSFTTNRLNNITNLNLNKQLIGKDEQELKTKINSNIINNKLNFLNEQNDNEQNDNEQNEFVSTDPLTRYLELHPKYLELFDRFYNFLFNGDGSLPYHIRHYIAIMASARHHCKYLVNDQQEQFKKVGGDLTWLNGIEYVPKKIQNLNEINKILAHQPWLLTKEHIERLTRGDDNWSLSELVQAIVIMAQFHTLSSFVFGCGFNDADLRCSTKLTPNSPNFNSNNISDLLLSQKYVSSAPPSPPSPNSNLNHLLNTDQNETESNLLNLINSNLNQQSNELDQSNKISKQDQQANYLEILMLKMQNISEQKQQQFELDNQEELSKQEELVKNQSLEIHLTPTQTLASEFSFNNGQKNSNSNNTSPNQLTSKCLGNANAEQYDIIKFIQDSKFCYQDFARQRALTDVNTFRVQDYSWPDHGYSLVNRLYSDVGYMLDEKFTTIYNLTYYTMGRKTNVDTRVFRQAIWNYIQCMYGIRHDDYDYHEINELLERPLKTYIKTVCCFPHQVRNKDCDFIMREFRRSEKIHVNIMIAEARLQAELLYALRTISKYMT